MKCSWSSVVLIASGVLIAFHLIVTVFPELEAVTLVGFSSWLNLVEVDEGSVPFLNNSVPTKSDGVQALGDCAGKVWSSTFALTTLAGFLNFSLLG